MCSNWLEAVLNAVHATSVARGLVYACPDTEARLPLCPCAPVAICPSLNRILSIYILMDSSMYCTPHDGWLRRPEHPTCIGQCRLAAQFTLRDLSLIHI